MDELSSTHMTLTLDEVAQELRVSKRQVERYVASGGLPAIVLGARMRRVYRADLVAFIEAHREAAA